MVRDTDKHHNYLEKSVYYLQAGKKNFLHPFYTVENYFVTSHETDTLDTRGKRYAI